MSAYTTPAPQRAQSAQYRRALYWQRRRRGLCTMCGGPVDDGAHACPTCRRYKAASQRRTYHARKEATA